VLSDIDTPNNSTAPQKILAKACSCFWEGSVVGSDMASQMVGNVTGSGHVHYKSW
jgi:hypothetical protein